MLNDIKPPPMDVDGNGHSAHPMHAKPHVDLREPGQHHARVMGEPTHIDPIYSMPLEERGSGFSIGLSIIVMVLVVTLLGTVWWMLG
jgi:hypothetical protein